MGFIKSIAVIGLCGLSFLGGRIYQYRQMTKEDVTYIIPGTTVEEKENYCAAKIQELKTKLFALKHRGGRQVSESALLFTQLDLGLKYDQRSDSFDTVLDWTTPEGRKSYRLVKENSRLEAKLIGNSDMPETTRIYEQPIQENVAELSSIDQRVETYGSWKPAN